MSKDTTTRCILTHHIMDFSLLSAAEFLNKEMKMCEIKESDIILNHLKKQKETLKFL